MLDFRIETTSGLAPYMQLVQQVKQALRLGWLQPGDKLPTVHEVAVGWRSTRTPCRRPTRSWSTKGLVVGRPGQGTFIQRSLSQATPGDVSGLGRRLERWIAAARAAGLDEDGIMDLVRATVRRSGIQDCA